MRSGAAGRARPTILIAALIASLLALLAAIPVPYYLIGPGTAVDLGKSITVAGRAAPLEHFYLTDVTLQRASILLLPGALIPGERLVREQEIVPRGVGAKRYQTILNDVMSESQEVAAVVAERAAGYAVPVPETHVYVREVTAASRAVHVLFSGDEILSVAGSRVRSSGEIVKRITALPPGKPVHIAVVRHGAALDLDVPTMGTKDGTRLGIIVGTRYARPKLPVAVTYHIENISGSSAGLMFALDIYRTLHPGERIRETQIAGTGTIAFDGSVGPIEGTMQKLIAAKRAGARLFLCPKENYHDVAHEGGVRVIPVGSFSDALRALRS